MMRPGITYDVHVQQAKKLSQMAGVTITHEGYGFVAHVNESHKLSSDDQESYEWFITRIKGK